MNVTVLVAHSGMEWLRDAHGVNIDGCTCAIVVGNEDSPTRIELYRADNIDALERVYEADDDGTLFLVPTGEHAE